MNVEQKSVKDIIPYTNNPRINNDAIDIVARSIKEFGFQVPIILDINNVIIAGHTRLQAAKKLGLEEVPTITPKDLSESQVKAFRIMDNKSAEASLWDMDKLRVEIEDLSNLDCDLSSIGFSADEIADVYYSQDDAPFDTAYSSMNDGDGRGRGEGEPNFNPSLEPNMSNRDVTEADLDRAKNKLDIEQRDGTKTISAICPECYNEFEIGV